MSPQVIFLAIVFVAVLGTGLMITYWLESRCDARAAAPTRWTAHPAGDRPGGWIESMVKLSGPLAKLSVPDEGWDNAPLRIRFMNAGFRGVRPR